MDEEVKRIGGKTEEWKQEESQCIWETIFICFVGSETNVLLSENVESAFWKEEGDIELCSFFFLFCFFLFFFSFSPPLSSPFFNMQYIYLYSSNWTLYRVLSHLSLVHLIPSLLPSHTVITFISFIIFPSTVSLRKIIGK